MVRRLQNLVYILLGGIVLVYAMFFGMSHSVLAGLFMIMGLYGFLFHKAEARRWHAFHERLGSRLSLESSELIYLFAGLGLLTAGTGYFVARVLG